MLAFYRQQQTIAKPVRIEGFGLWSGQDVQLEFHPAEPDRGIVFVRDDLTGRPCIPGLYYQRLDSPRRTVLAAGDARAEMVEHVMAALAGLRIDNCEVHLTAAEVPGLDGSSAPLVELLRAAGLVQQPAARRALVVTETIRVGSQESWIEARPGRGFRIAYQLDYGTDHPVGQQSLELPIDPEAFTRELSSARTFILKHEAEQLRAAGLALRTTTRDVLVFDQKGVIDNTLRFPDECVRHKMLDVLGDLSLAGVDLEGTFVAYRSGHRLNAALVERLWAHEQSSGLWNRWAS